MPNAVSLVYNTKKNDTTQKMMSSSHTSILLSGAGNPETKVAVPVVRVDVAPVRNRAVEAVVVVAAAAVDAVGRRRAPLAVAPFPDVTTHVVKPQCIRHFLSYFMRYSIPI